MVRIARALQTSRPGPQATGKRVKSLMGGAGPDMFCSRLAERGMKNTVGARWGWGRPLHVLSQNHQADREESEKHCSGGGGGVGVGGGGGGRWDRLAVGCRKIYLRRTFFV